MRCREKQVYLSAEIPQDLLACGLRVILLGLRVVLVEGQRGVVELSENRIRIKTTDGILSVEGEAMTLYELSADAAMINSARIQMISCAH